jgi:hypothetical protein
MKGAGQEGRFRITDCGIQNGREMTLDAGHLTLGNLLLGVGRLMFHRVIRTTPEPETGHRGLTGFATIEQSEMGTCAFGVERGSTEGDDREIAIPHANMRQAALSIRIYIRITHGSFEQIR